MNDFDDQVSRSLADRAAMADYVPGDVQDVRRRGMRRKVVRRSMIGAGALAVIAAAGIGVAVRSGSSNTSAADSNTSSTVATTIPATPGGCAAGQVRSSEGDILLHDGVPYRVDTGQCIGGIKEAGSGQMVSCAGAAPGNVNASESADPSTTSSYPVTTTVSPSGDPVWCCVAVGDAGAPGVVTVVGSNGEPPANVSSAGVSAVATGGAVHVVGSASGTTSAVQSGSGTITTIVGGDGSLPTIAANCATPVDVPAAPPTIPATTMPSTTTP